MPKKALFLLAEFDEDSQHICTSLYDLLKAKGFRGRQSKHLPYHFTLGQFDLSKEASLPLLMDEIAKDTKQIDLRMNHLGLFGLEVLFLEPAVNIELLQLVRQFFPKEGLGKHQFVAHTTILKDKEDEILRALPILAKNFKPFHARIEILTLYEFFPVRLIHRVKLKDSY